MDDKLYRKVNNESGSVVYVAVEPTDRICRTHNYWMDTAETICDVRWANDRQTECSTFDVVRVPKEDNE